MAWTGNRVLSGVNPAWDRGSPSAPGGCAGTPGACQSRWATPSLSFLICKMGCFFTKAEQSQERFHQAAFTSSSPAPILSEAKEAQPAQTFLIPPRPDSRGQAERGPGRPDPAHQAGHAGLRVNLCKECLPPGSLSSAGRESGECVHTQIALRDCKPALMLWERRGPLSEAVHK